MNAASPLTIETPDGSGEAVHPDVLFVPGGFAGHTHWLACTPYPRGDDRLENPIVRVSADGRRWQRLPGAPDPVVAAPVDPEWHHADTDLVLHDGRLHLFYIATNRRTGATRFELVTSSDGIVWSTPRSVYQGAWGVSPAVCATADGRWHMWYVLRDALGDGQSAQLMRRDGDGPDRFGMPEPCELEVAGHVVWHLDVVATDRGYEALVTAFPRGSDPSRSRLFHACSGDGRRFELSRREPLLRPSWFGWDNRMIYRSTFLKGQGGAYRVWYSAASWGMRCGIGLLEGAALGALDDVGAGRAGTSAAARVGADLVGLAKHAVKRALPAPALGALQRLRTSLRRRSAGRA